MHCAAGAVHSPSPVKPATTPQAVKTSAAGTQPKAKKARKDGAAAASAAAASAADKPPAMSSAQGTAKRTLLEQYCAATNQTCCQMLDQAELARATAAKLPEDHYALLVTAKEAQFTKMEVSSITVLASGKNTGKNKAVDPDARAKVLLGILLGPDKGSVKKHVAGVVKTRNASADVVAQALGELGSVNAFYVVKNKNTNSPEAKRYADPKQRLVDLLERVHSRIDSRIG